MGYRVRINNVTNHPTGSMIFLDKKEKIRMVITGEWKTIAKKTEKLKKWEAGRLVQVETLKSAKIEIEKEIEKVELIVEPVIEVKEDIEGLEETEGIEPVIEIEKPIVEKKQEPVKKVIKKKRKR